MQARMKHPAFVLPQAMQAMVALGKSTENELSVTIRKLVELRASQINGCSVCVLMHAEELKKAGDTDQRIFAVAAWRDTPYFADEERAALALAESVTRLSDRADPVPDDVWNEATRYFDEKQLAALVVEIAMINVWNRLNASVRQVAGAPWK
jgi:AhpD family alkylhydroperoxidase